MSDELRLNDEPTGTDHAVPVNREHWLELAVEKLRPVFRERGYTIPARVRVSVGWPSTGGLRDKSRVEGECWALEAADDKVPQIFLTPLHGEGLYVLKVLVHELGHAVLGSAAGHKAPFARFCQRVGLEGKPTSALPGDEFTDDVLRPMLDELGEYPHTAIKTDGRKKQGTRLVKIKCWDCGYTARTTRTWLDTGNLTCTCGGTLVEGLPLDELDEDERDELLMPTDAILGYRTADNRFELRYIKETVELVMSGKRERRRWIIVDHEANAVKACVIGTKREYVLDAETRTTVLPTRHDALGFLQAVRDDVYRYPELDGDDGIDAGIDDEDFLSDDEIEVPDNPDADDDITLEYERVELRRLHPGWDDERIEREARKRTFDDVYPAPSTDESGK